MVIQSWIYDAILYLYALSLLFYFSDFVGANQSAKRIGTGLLIFVWVLQTIYFIVELRILRLFTMEESLFFFSWVLVTVSLVVNRFFRIDLFVFFVNVLGFAVLALHIFSRSDIVPSLKGWEVADELLFIHMSLAIGSYAAFTISAVFSGMYLFLHGQLKGKIWSKTMRRLPSLEKIDKYSTTAVVIGVPLLLLSLSLGIVWIFIEGRLQLLLDAKVLNTLLVLLVYLYSLLLKMSVKVSSVRLAQWNLFAILMVILNYFFTSRFSHFHQWIWT